ncbi:MAG TPA: beta-ketoacyl-ACP synthase II [Myxococcota bacterium]|jgi:3-oxoacyl-[acyl-carrier-protein] synthase II|nr:beta-ketoacyl-ACP synthase II [Myxococcota bacterium]
MAARAERRRVVVTGLGCITPLGTDVSSSWDAAVAGTCGVGPITRFDTTDFPVRIAAQAADELPLGDVPPKEARRLDRYIQLAVAAAQQAAADAGLDGARFDRTRAGVAIGSGIGGLGTLIENDRVFLKSGPRRVSPFMIPMTIANMASGYVSIRLGLEGPNFAHVSACATGAHALGEAARAIERGDVDLMLAGASEAAITDLGVAAFASMRALSSRNDEPARASRPFDRERDGFVLGEGAGVLVIEALDHAERRGARVRAELAGYAATADACQIAAPDETGRGAERCMRLALADAGLPPEAVDTLNAHATSTPAGDPVEAAAIRRVFGAHAPRVAVSATKSMTGHLLGAAGGVEAIFCVRSLETGVIPPTINLDAVDEGCELDHVSGKARAAAVRVALSNSFGFGGTNASLVLVRFDG